VEAQHNEAALAGPAPRLDLSVDGHVHTGFAKGRLSVGALVTAAEDAGLTQVTFADLAGPEWGFSAPAGKGIDHVLVRGAQAGPEETWPRERRRVGGRLLSDHAPVEVRIR